MKLAPRIVLVANLWTLAGHPSPRREWTLDRKLAAVAAAGFDAAMCPAVPGLKRRLRAHGLRYTGFIVPRAPRDCDGLVRRQRAQGAENINAQIGDGSTSVREALAWSTALVRAARRHGVPVGIEVHRNTALETSERLRALAAAHRAATGELLPLTWDHSHPAVVKHLKPASFAAELLRERALIQACRQLHCRPFNGQHAQVPVFDARRRQTPEFRDWLGFVAELFRCWLAGPRPGNELWVCPEIGPVGVHGYNLSTMPPSWAQAIVCRRELAALWRACGGN